jgi:hypothetical protein
VLADCCGRVIDLASAASVPAGDELVGDTRRGEDTRNAFRRAHRR